MRLALADALLVHALQRVRSCEWVWHALAQWPHNRSQRHTQLAALRASTRISHWLLAHLQSSHSVQVSRSFRRAETELNCIELVQCVAGEQRCTRVHSNASPRILVDCGRLPASFDTPLSVAARTVARAQNGAMCARVCFCSTEMCEIIRTSHFGPLVAYRLFIDRMASEWPTKEEGCKIRRRRRRFRPQQCDKDMCRRKVHPMQPEDNLRAEASRSRPQAPRLHRPLCPLRPNPRPQIRPALFLNPIRK